MGCGGDATPPEGSTESDSGEDVGATEAGTTAGASSAADADGSDDATPANPCEQVLPELDELPLLLSETGLYADIATRQVSAAAREFAPQFPLWTDGTLKRRWIYLPGCEPIDTSDMDFWSFPVGTRAWKEFVVASAGGDMLLETRMIVRTGPGEDDFLFASYRWNDSETNASLLLDGEGNVRGTDHDIPDEDQCRECHGGSGDGGGDWGGGGGSSWGGRDGGGTPSRILGFGAIQLSHDGPGLNLLDLVDEGRLSVAPQGNFAVPDGMNGTAAAVIGNFHGNCGHCHNTTADAVRDVDMDMWLSVDATTVESTGVYQTTVNVPSQDWGNGARIVPGDPAASEVYVRDSERGGSSSDQMPPLGTEITDDAALADLQAWICALAPC